MASLAPMASIYARGRRLWGRIKDESGKWVSKPTDFNVGQEEQARREIAAAQRLLDNRRARAEGGPLTLSRLAESWLTEREKRGLRSVRDDRGRLTNHVLPVIGHMHPSEVRPRVIRDLVRSLVQSRDLAPRTIRNVYGITHALFHDLVVDEIIQGNPCVLKRGELPGKTDKDPEWRNAATFTIDEVRALLWDERIPAQRRIQYALKALAGLRHGEVAGLRWRLYEADVEPLGRLLIATSYDTGRTKTEIARRVPVHQVLAELLNAWRAEWPTVYGRKPKPTDLLVPTKNMTPIDPADAVHAFVADLEALEFRTEAGKHRNRGGHDLRAWFITSCQEAGAHRDLLRIVTHTEKGDVVSGYTRATWAALCAEVAKLAVRADGSGRK